jgi:hypothetical protein
MVEILYEFKGQRFQLDDIPNDAQRASLSTVGDSICNIADQLTCPECGKLCRLEALVGSSGSQMGAFVLDVCHVEYLDVVNSKLPNWLKLQAQNS